MRNEVPSRYSHRLYDVSQDRPDSAEPRFDFGTDRRVSRRIAPVGDFQVVVAELSMALAGFSGLVMGIKATRHNRWLTQDRIGLRIILSTSRCAMFFSLAPAAVLATGADALLFGAALSVLLALIIVTSCAATAFAALHSRPRHPWSFWPLCGSGIVIGLSLAATSLFGSWSRFLPLALVWLLVVGFAQFFTFLVLSGTEDKDHRQRT